MALLSLLLTLVLTPSLHGESLHYEIRWTGLRAGEMTLTVENYGDLLFIEQHTWSTGFFGKIFPMDDTYRSWVELPSFRSVLFSKKIRQKKKRKEESIFFDWEGGFSYYRDRLTPLPSHAVDTLSSVFLLRHSLESLPVDLTVHDRGKTYVLRVEKTSIDYLDIGDRKVKTLRVKPLLIKGEAREEAELILWFTDTPERVLVRMKFAIALGSITATLDPYCE